jgi:branched-chain amino acid transport system ATP-binding protein
MLEVQSLEAWYGQAQVLYGVSLGVGAGECVALVGRNGAGKSTTMKAIMGLMARRRGRVVFRGADISSAPPTASAGSASAGCPRTGASSPTSAVRENLAVARQPPRDGAPTWTEDKLYALFPNLAAMPDRPAAA